MGKRTEEEAEIWLTTLGTGTRTAGRDFRTCRATTRERTADGGSHPHIRLPQVHGKLLFKR